MRTKKKREVNIGEEGNKEEKSVYWKWEKNYPSRNRRHTSQKCHEYGTHYVTERKATKKIVNEFLEWWLEVILSTWEKNSIC